MSAWFVVYHDGDGKFVDICKEPDGLHFTPGDEPELYAEFNAWNNARAVKLSTVDKEMPPDPIDVLRNKSEQDWTVDDMKAGLRMLLGDL